MQDEDKFKCKLCKNAYSYEGTLKTHEYAAEKKAPAKMQKNINVTFMEKTIRQFILQKKRR